MNTYEKAISLIKIRPHHSAELAKKLTQRGFNTTEIAETIDKLIEQRLIDNDQFVQVFLENHIRYKTFGFYGLKAKLMQRGVPGSDAETHLKEILTVEAEQEIAQRLREREKNIDKVKFAQKLQRKGFRSEVIQNVIRDL